MGEERHHEIILSSDGESVEEERNDERRPSNAAHFIQDNFTNMSKKALKN